MRRRVLPGHDRLHRGPSHLCFVECPPHGPPSVSRSVDTDHHSTTVGGDPLGVGDLPDDGQRASCVVDAPLADRSDQQPQETVRPPGPDDEEIGLFASVDQLFGGGAPEHFTSDNQVGVPESSESHGIIDHGLVDRLDPRPVGQPLWYPVRLDGPDVHDVQDGVTGAGLVGRPLQGMPGVAGAIDPDDDPPVVPYFIDHRVSSHGDIQRLPDSCAADRRHSCPNLINDPLSIMHSDTPRHRAPFTEVGAGLEVTVFTHPLPLPSSSAIATGGGRAELPIARCLVRAGLRGRWCRSALGGEGRRRDNGEVSDGIQPNGGSNGESTATRVPPQASGPFRFLARRLAAEHARGSLHRDSEYIAKQIGRIRLLTSYFSPEVRGIEHLPIDGPALLIGNHNAVSYMPDAWVTALAIVDRRGTESPAYTLTYDLLLTFPIVGPFLRRIGAVPAGTDQAEAALAEGAVVLDYPGGDWEACRPWSARNTIDFEGRTGFVRLALHTGVPLIPVVSQGSHDSLVVLSRGTWLARAMGLPAMHIKVFPILLGPLGITTALLPPPPLPSHITVEFLAPMTWADLGPEAAEDPAVVARCANEVISVMQEALDRLQVDHPHPVLTGLGNLITHPGHR